MADDALDDLRQVETELNTRWPETKIEPTLQRVAALVDLLGDPHRSYPVLHVAGTNGKTSVTRMIDALLTRIGLRTGRFTSPHLQLVTERIAVDNAPIAPERYVEVYRDIEPYVAMIDRGAEVQMSKFEVLTAMAFAAFADAPVDAAVLEVGLGGSWDATNVADAKVAIVAPIEIDHVEYLGSDIVGIAKEKGGIMDLRDHLFAKAPYLIGGEQMPDHSDVDVLELAEGNGHHGVPESGFGRVPAKGAAQATRPLVGTAEVGGVIDPDVLWSCTTCGACVDQCPVDIEHVDHIVDMRRYQVMIESEFPSELGTLFRNLENKGNPWGQNNSARMDWAKDLPFEVPVYDGELAPDVEYLYWIGCAGSFDDNAKKTVRATAELLNIAGVKYVVLGNEESCTGDPARRAGNEFLFQMMAQQTAEMLNSVFDGREPEKRKIITTCPHCMNTLAREYPQLESMIPNFEGTNGHWEVMHHTQVLNRLVRDGKLTPVKPADGGTPVTYHDPCYLGRHNKVYEPPRELVGAAGAKLTEMPRHADRALCCGAGGARMWMEEHIGKRINLERVDEALNTDAKEIVTGCPFCRVMVTDGLVQRQSEDKGTDVQVRDVSQMLLESVKRGQQG